VGLVAADFGCNFPGGWFWNHVGAWARWLGIILILIDLWIIHSLFVHRREPA
jgi:hypothetical protein